ncbi:putative ABC transport system permease protein [Nocardia amikacinitolerans]|uniref:Putative ABC transport system permease protein n=1 Tax=Nocardia amikacinitolerans TaxID=756689 RepID=A0A285LU27_9NOCA|nr:FtsX-like permease family protein [Nocardia amikacinitolerans]SNY88429.1 putative ABC transport system permease protein [Nocardia amikacinitolerans]
MIRAAWDRLRLFNFGELLAHRGRTVMSMTVMAVSASLLVAVLSISGSVTGSVDRLTKALGGKAALEITGITDAGFDQQLLQRITATPGVDQAVPMLRAQLGSGEDRALLLGAEANITALDSELAGPMGAHTTKLITTPRGVLVGAAMGYAEGEEFPLGIGTVTVAGVLDTETSDKLNGGHIVAAPLGLAQFLTDRVGKLDSVQIIADDGADLGELRAALTAAVDGRAVVADPDLRTAQAGGAIQIVRYSTLMSSAAALIVSAFLIYNAMSMAVAQRRPTLSLLRAIGGKRGPMVRDLLAEAALLGLLGSAIGAVLGIFMGRTAIDRLPAAMVQSVEARTEYMVPGYAVPAAVAACVLASVTAATLAARQVYKVQPIEALAPVGVGQADTARPLLRWSAAVFGIGLAVGAVLVARADLGRLSLASISLAFTATLLVCFAATGPIVRTAAAIARRFGAPGALGSTTLERAPRRVWATAMTVMIGVSATVAMGGASANMVDSATATFEDLGTADVYVSPTAMEQFPTGPLLPDELKDIVAKVPGVEQVSPAQMAFATLGTGRVMLQGYPTAQGDIRSNAVDRSLLPRMTSGEGVVISRDVARSLDVNAGAELTLQTPTGPHRVEVLQVIPYVSAISGIVMMDLEHLRQWYQRPGETILSVQMAPGADPAAVQAAIRAAVPEQFHVSSGQDAVTAISSSMRQGSVMSRAILWIVVLVATIALLNTLMLSVLERRRELGVLRAMGTSRKFLLRSVLAEAAGIGFIGAAIGLVVGAAIQYLATVAIGHAMTIDIVYEPSPMLLVYGAAALTLALLGSIPPALRAARMPIVEALAVD